MTSAPSSTVTSFQTTDRSTRAVGEMVALGSTSPRACQSCHCERRPEVRPGRSDVRERPFGSPTANGIRAATHQPGIDLPHAFAGLTIDGVHERFAPCHLNADEMQAALAPAGESGDPPVLDPHATVTFRLRVLDRAPW